MRLQGYVEDHSIFFPRENLSLQNPLGGCLRKELVPRDPGAQAGGAAYNPHRSQVRAIPGCKDVGTGEAGSGWNPVLCKLSDASL